MTGRLVRAAQRVEEADFLDRVDGAARPLASVLVRSQRSQAILHGHWLGHAVHPLLTDLPLGMWMSGTALDLVGDRGSEPAARRLIGLGLLAALPTALTGWAEWAAVDERRDRRTGLVHAAVNVTALGLYTASWGARRKGNQAGGVRLAVAGGLAATVGGFFGGHLTEARKVSSRHPVFEGGDPPTAP